MWRPGRVSELCGAACLLLALTIAATWPLLPNLSRAASDPGDPYINTFILDWVWHQTFRDPLDLFEAPILFPAHHTLAFSEHLYGLGVLSFPMRALGAGPLTAYNILLLLGFVASGLGAYVLTRHVTGSLGAATVAAIAYAYVPYRFEQLSHIQHVWSPLLPLVLWASLRFAASPRRRRAAVVGAIVVALGLTNIHWLLFGLVATALSAAVLMRSVAPELRTTYARRGLLAVAVAILLLLPFLQPYRVVKEKYGLSRPRAETASYSAVAREWLVSAAANDTYRALVDQSVDPERRLFPGAGILILAIVAFLWWPSHTPHRSMLTAVLMLWAVVGFLGSLGLNAFFHRFLFDHVEAFRGIRVPARWAMVTFTSLAVLAGLGAEAIASRAGRARSAVFLVIGGLLFVELNAAPIRWHLRDTDEASVYEWLRHLPDGGGVLELPINSRTSEYEYTLAATIHHRPIVNGASGFSTSFHEEIAALAHSNPIPSRLIDRLAQNDVRLLVIHVDTLGEHEQATRELVREQLADGRLAYAGSFEHQHRGDLVFYLPRPGRESRLLDANQARGAGARSDDRLIRFIEGRGFGYNPQLAGILDHPMAGQQVRGPLHIRGWATSPHGVRRVTALMNNGRLRIPARLATSDRLTRVFPWYSQSMGTAAFSLEIDAKPEHVWCSTDVQIELEDAAGRVERLPQIWIEWEVDSDH